MTQTEKQKVMSKIKKLFELGGSSNENEAALAVEMASQLLEKYELSQEEIAKFKDGNVAIVERAFGDYRARRTNWDMHIFFGLAVVFDCEYFSRKNYKHGSKTIDLCVVGHEADVEVFGFTYNFLKRKCDTMGESWYNTQTRRGMVYDSAVRAKTSYRVGFATRIVTRVKARKAERMQANDDCKALVHNKTAVVQKFVKENFNIVNGGKKKWSPIDGGAYRSGQSGADSVNLQDAVKTSKKHDEIT